MKFKIVYFLFCLLLFGCKKAEKNQEILESNKPKKSDSITVKSEENKYKKELANFFNYNRVEYYYKDVSEKAILNILKEGYSKPVDSSKYLYAELVTGNHPNFLSKKLENDLSKFGFKKETLQKNKYIELNAIFRETICDDVYAASCTPIYRDILIFYKNNDIVGVSKICFDCRQYKMIGTKEKTENFGQCGGFEKLYKILRK